MPRGVPALGYRKTKKILEELELESECEILPLEIEETDEIISKRISQRFDVLSRLTTSAIEGHTRAVIGSGPPGIGKSYTLSKALKNYDPDNEKTTIIKGFVRATGLYKAIYNRRNEGDILVFDDADSVFADETSLNILKAACDTTDIRKIGWAAETRMETDEGDPLPTSFEFNGSIIFLTNKDFDVLIEKQHKLTPHLEALISRSYYLHLGMRTKRDYLIRILQVVNEGMLKEQGINKKTENQIIDYIRSNQDRMTEMSLRTVTKIANLTKADDNWQEIANLTILR